MDNEKDFEKDGVSEEFLDDDMDNVVTLKDEETGEEFEFAYIDNFDFNNKKYAVLLTMDEEDPEMVIFEEIEDADGEITIASLDEADEDAVYDYYDSLCDEYFDDEDESEE
ncbi:MAG: DUF1292 domain-containing protein [Clostridia bacterium]|nr:DUF1292 domain-containing protein [Clostridiales bacterium]MCR5804765.1 DUF1292 domain-containing protein [Clostridia bacterium]